MLADAGLADVKFKVEFCINVGWFEVAGGSIELLGEKRDGISLCMSEESFECDKSKKEPSSAALDWKLPKSFSRPKPVTTHEHVTLHGLPKI